MDTSDSVLEYVSGRSEICSTGAGSICFRNLHFDCVCFVLCAAIVLIPGEAVSFVDFNSIPILDFICCSLSETSLGILLVLMKKCLNFEDFLLMVWKSVWFWELTLCHNFTIAQVFDNNCYIPIEALNFFSCAGDAQTNLLHVSGWFWR